MRLKNMPIMNTLPLRKKIVQIEKRSTVTKIDRIATCGRKMNLKITLEA